jgi:hypothetical protein
LSDEREKEGEEKRRKFIAGLVVRAKKKIMREVGGLYINSEKLTIIWVDWEEAINSRIKI